MAPTKMTIISIPVQMPHNNCSNIPLRRTVAQKRATIIAYIDIALMSVCIGLLALSMGYILMSDTQGPRANYKHLEGVENDSNDPLNPDVKNTHEDFYDENFGSGGDLAVNFAGQAKQQVGAFIAVLIISSILYLYLATVLLKGAKERIYGKVNRWVIIQIILLGMSIFFRLQSLLVTTKPPTLAIIGVVYRAFTIFFVWQFRLELNQERLANGGPVGQGIIYLENQNIPGPSTAYMDAPPPKYEDVVYPPPPPTTQQQQNLHQQ